MSNAITTETTYAIIDAEGHHGDFVTVWDAGVPESKARGRIKDKTVMAVSGCHHAKGDKIRRGIAADMIASGRWSVLSK